MSTEQFDVTIIGSGPGGYVAAIRAGQLGLKAAIVEKDNRLGGTCTLRGCIPTKQMLMSAHVYEQMQHAADFGVQASGIQLAFADVQKRKDKVVLKNSKGFMPVKRPDLHAGCASAHHVVVPRQAPAEPVC